jgi:dsDNA-specific endonuclease/ATPase MutS2
LAEKIAEKLNITDKTVIECKDYELLQGDMKNPLWILKIHDELRVVLEVDEYMRLLETLKNIMKENFELKLEKAILSEFPVDYDDVKAVVLKEMKRNENASINEIIDKVKLEHPNLFYNLDFEKIF